MATGEQGTRWVGDPSLGGEEEEEGEVEERE